MKFKKTTLRNGLRIVSVPMPDNPSVTVLVMVEAGSKYESKNINGLSHFLEHMVFKGTPKRPKAINISRELDSIGAQYNAFTSHEYTGYYAKADKRHFDKILDIVSDMYLNPLFDEKEINKEKGVIIEEIRMYQDLPQKHAQDLIMDVLYGDQPAGWYIAGTEDNVRSFKRENFLDYRSKNYVASATTIIVAGSFKETEVISKVKKVMSNVSVEKKEGKLPVKESQNEPQIKVDFKETDQTHLVVGLRTFPVLDRKIPALMVLSAILGGGMSSRLFSKMRDDLGICYYIKAEQELFTDHGVLLISAGVDNARVKEGVQGILGECERLKKELVNPLELQKVKDYIAGMTMLQLETSDARAEFVAYEEVLKKKIQLPAEFIKEVNRVTAKQVQELAKKIFVNQGLNMAIVGRFKDNSEFKEYFKFN